MENDVIDVTGMSFKLPQNPLKDFEEEITPWPHPVITSYKALENATDQQRVFYYQFREAFRKTALIDLKGNDNYALLLLFELINKYDRKGETDALKASLQLLTKHYPSTTDNAIKLLAERSLALSEILPEVYAHRQKSNIDGLTLITRSEKVPFWQTEPITTHKQLAEASDEQRVCYYHLREAFRRKEFFDLEGNENYAKILLFELINKYTVHKDFLRISGELSLLETGYPNFLSDWKRILLTRMREIGDLSGIEQITDIYPELNSATPKPVADKQITKPWQSLQSDLQLAEEEIKLIDSFYNYSNTFFSIPFCQKEVLRLFILSIRQVNLRLEHENNSLKKELLAIADFIVQKQFKFSPDSSYYTYYIESALTDIHTYILKLCENAVREVYLHKRRINTETAHADTEINQQLNDRIISKLEQAIPENISNILPPDQETEISLNEQNTARWKQQLQDLIEAPGNNSTLVTSITELVKLNSRNPYGDNIYYDASKLVAPNNIQQALELYAWYIYTGLGAKAPDNRPLPKSTLKLLPSKEQEQTFTTVIQQLRKDKNLPLALSEIEQIFKPKRKRIQLNTQEIEAVETLHSGTVALLNGYLRDEEETPVFNETVNTVDIENASTKYKLQFTPAQLSAVEEFSKNDFVLEMTEAESISNNHGIFKNMLIDGVNEACYDLLDDILIEEEDSSYIMNENYYQRILTI